MNQITLQNKNTPKLRFSEFINGWEEKKLGECLLIKHGKSQQDVVINEGGFPILASGGEIGRAMKPLYSKPSVLIGRKGTIDTPQYMDTPFWTVDTLFYSEVFKNNNAKFLYYLFLTINWRKYNEGSGVPSLSASTISSIKRNVPSEEEQHKVADFLTAVDEKISKLQKKVELLKKYKKGVMQKIFSQKIRFKDENGKDYPEWEEKSIGEIFERITERNKEDNHNVLTISAQYGLINQEKFFNKSVAASDLTGYYLLQKGDFAYNKSYSNGYPMGAIKKLNIYEKGVVSTLYICFRTKMDQDSDFYEQYFEYGLQNKEIEKIAQEGARNHGLLNISVVDFFDQIYLQVPSYDEQVRISKFLIRLDMRINLEERKLEQAKRFKKSLLQQMFI